MVFGLRGVAPGVRFWHCPGRFEAALWAGKASFLCARRLPRRWRGVTAGSEANSMTALWMIVLCGVLSILYAIWATVSVLKADAGNPRMQEIAAAVREGAQAYLRRQYTTIGIVGVVIFLIVGWLLGWPV